MKTKRYYVLAGFLLLILVVGVACNKVDVERGGILSTSNVIGHPLHIAKLQAIRGVSLLGDPSPWFALSSGGNSLELWSSMTTEKKAAFWPILNIDRSKYGDFVIVTGELNLHVKNITWAVIINKTD